MSYLWSHLTDWCSLHRDGKKVICPRVRSTVKIKNAGWLHKVQDNGLKKHKKPHKQRSNACINWEATSKLYEKKLIARHPYDLVRDLGLKSTDTLRQFRVGWDTEAYTIPCYDGEEYMIGIMRRFPDGKKMYVSRSKNGLFIPQMRSCEGNVFITEGFSDGASLVDIGFRALGRANCETGVGYIKRWLYEHKKVAQVTVVADNDTDNVNGNVGQRGAKSLSRELYGGRQRIAVLEVPPAFKDIRVWITEGLAKTDDIIRRSRVI